MKAIWPLIILVGLLSTFFYDFGVGGAGTLIFACGVIGGLIVSWRLVLTNKTRSKNLTIVSSITWALTMLSTLGLMGGWFFEGFKGFIWMYIAGIFAILGLILMTIDLSRSS
jgi:hypothetical protein